MATDTIISAAVGGLFIGAAAVLLLALTGRIAGVSGFASRLLPPYSDNQLPVRLAFVAGLVIAPLLYVASTGTPVAIEVTSSLPLLIAGGVLVGFGAVRGNGCTSGHGICGTARLSQRSIAATVIFMTTGALTVYIMRHVLGG